jgi:hypothetical protein
MNVYCHCVPDEMEFVYIFVTNVYVQYYDCDIFNSSYYINYCTNKNM